MRTVGKFSKENNEALNILGHLIATDIIEKVKTGELSIDDDMFKEFLPCIFGEGNLEFLKLIAEKVYLDSRKEVIIEFVNYVQKMTEEGHKQMDSKMRDKLGF